VSDSDKDKIILFPTNRIVDLSKTGPAEKSNNNVRDTETLKRIQEDQTKQFCDGVVDDMSMNLLRGFVEIAIKTNNINFTKDLALLIDVLRGLIYRDFGLTHPMHQLVEKMVDIRTLKNGQQSAKINYSTVINTKKQSVPLSKDVKNELKDIQDGAHTLFNGDNLNDE
jgi:hypothetical protein